MATTTVMIVNVILVVVPSVALTKIPTVPVTVPELNVTVAPLPLSDPSVILVRVQA
jgi:hypothetical protein